MLCRQVSQASLRVQDISLRKLHPATFSGPKHKMMQCLKGTTPSLGVVQEMLTGLSQNLLNSIENYLPVLVPCALVQSSLLAEPQPECFYMYDTKHSNISLRFIDPTEKKVCISRVGTLTITELHFFLVIVFQAISY